MTTTVAKHGRVGRPPRRHLLHAVAASPVAVCLAVALATGGGTYALWSNQATYAGGTVTAGDLNMAVGTPTWAQITEGDTTPGSGQLLTTPVNFRSMPGDVVQIKVPVTTTLRGDNLIGGIEATFAHPEALAEDIDAGLLSAGFHLEDSTGTQVAPAEGDADLGSAVELAGILGDDDGEVDNWTVVVTVHVLGDYRWVTDDLDGYPGDWAAGDLLIRLVQMRFVPDDTTAGGAQ